jgi:hypothetical protein
MKTGETYVRVHDCQLEGDDTTFDFKDENAVWWTFREHPEYVNELHEGKIWDYFLEPDIPTLKEANREIYDQNNEQLNMIQDISGAFKYFPGQRDFLCRFAMLRTGCCAIETGGGKTLAAFSLYYLKRAKRAIFIVPKGTSVGDDGNKIKVDYTPQWLAEAQKFAPDVPVYTLFKKQDYYDLLNENDRLPVGIYITYSHAMFNNEGAFENLPRTKKWKGDAGEEEFCKKYNIPYVENGTRYTDGIGDEKNGILCVATPSLATLCQDQFDMGVVDEAHCMCNLNTNITRGLLRLQPKYRFALTATPMPNYVYNLFAIQGWLSVDNWRFGRRRVPIWPYGVEEIGRFKSAHVSKERDLTAEEIADECGRNRPPPKDSPVISQKAKLIYQLRRSIGYMSKDMINPDMVACHTQTIKVPMGKQQHALYAHYLERKNMPPEMNPLAQAMTQQTYLRCISADPATLDYNNIEGKIVTSNYNPKTVAILSRIADLVTIGEQVVFVAFKNGQIDEVRRRLEESNVSYSMIRGGTNQALEAANFKSGLSQVMLMNISCAQAFSFSNCSHLIIGSLDWSFGKFAQACGRIYRLDSPKDCHVSVILHENTIEELLFEKVATKSDAASNALQGQASKTDVKTVSAAELLAENYTNFSESLSGVMDEEDCEREWPELMARLKGELVTA